ncbi:hypothetical protein BCR34DRAFT_18699 [Clohesyomyces aquaticus]|uniref:Uncharacterized protein n=1 Tax=Clohesyomyces aquaticus TaxID=1231657 RepID=A0A1Y1ZB94_9PLEO|nr:hypothetical protein BCR34DRAFT_18699 [Clohesyomyces aquaticus]
MPTSCEGSIFGNDRFKSTCTGTGYQLSCITGTIFATPGDPSPVSNYQCWPSWTDGNWEATRSVPLSSSIPSPSLTSAPVLLTISSSQPSSSTASTRPEGSGGGGPNGKLIGSIVGPILGFFAVAGIVAFFVIRCLRNRKRIREERKISTVYIDHAGNEFHIKQPGHWTERAFSTPSTSPVVDGNVSPVSPASQVHVEPTLGMDRYGHILYNTNSRDSRAPLEAQASPIPGTANTLS